MATRAVSSPSPSPPPPSSSRGGAAGEGAGSRARSPQRTPTQAAASPSPSPRRASPARASKTKAREQLARGAEQGEGEGEGEDDEDDEDEDDEESPARAGKRRGGGASSGSAEPGGKRSKARRTSASSSAREDAALQDEEEAAEESAAKPMKAAAAGRALPDLAGRPMFPRSPIARRPEPAAAERVRIMCWNVVSMNAAVRRAKSDIQAVVRECRPDVVFFSETKLQDAACAQFRDLLGDGYAAHFSCSMEKKGYSGTAAFVHKRLAVKSVRFGLDDAVGGRDPGEGRSITLELPDFWWVGLYVVNSGEGLKRLDFRIKSWDPAVRDYLAKLSATKPVVMGGDLNVAHKDVDVWNATAPHIKKQAGCTAEERASFSLLLESQARVDAFRALYPEASGHFSYWSMRAQNRPVNRGLRLDAFVVPASMMQPDAAVRVNDCWIHDDPKRTSFSDHAPILCDVVVAGSASSSEAVAGGGASGSAPASAS